jgi:8-amino-7-oxononanoate synthase
MSGTCAEHLLLEGALAAWLGTPACLVFSSGYAANTGVISALAIKGDRLFSDALNHASIIDGCRLSGAETVVVPHLDLTALAGALERSGRGGSRWVVTESYFGMDADSPDLAALRQLCDQHGAGLIVDEAHALGVFGPEGRGLCAASGIVPDVLVGGMGKALGLQGGFAASSESFRAWFWNRARSFGFSTAFSPLLSALGVEQLAKLRQADHPRRRLIQHELRLQQRLLNEGVPLAPGRHGPIFPVIVGSEELTLAAAQALLARGIVCQAIRPPTVPRGTSRLRVTLRADMSEGDVEQLADALISVCAPPVSAAGAPVPARGALASDAPEGRDHLPSPARAAEAAGTAARADAATHEPPRALDGPVWIVLGTGTEVGKTFVAEALVRLLAGRGRAVAGLKPIETGLDSGSLLSSDASRLAAASFHVKQPSPHPLYGFSDPVTPALAARRAGISILLPHLQKWLQQVAAERPVDGPCCAVLETAGGVFSPLGPALSNFDLALSVGPARWILVAPDRLGVLHEVIASLGAMASLGRSPDWIVLSAPSAADASTGQNLSELQAWGVATPILALARGETVPLGLLLDGA